MLGVQPGLGGPHCTQYHMRLQLWRPPQPSAGGEKGVPLQNLRRLHSWRGALAIV